MVGFTEYGHKFLTSIKGGTFLLAVEEKSFLWVWLVSWFGLVCSVLICSALIGRLF
jgi:hypothetical protein